MAKRNAMKVNPKAHAVDVDKARYIYQKLEHCIKNGYKDLSLKYLAELVDVLVGED